MNITLRTPLSFSEIGKKDNQEDRLYPQGAEADSRFFILCDGMGGHERGEVAAEVVSTSLGAYLQANMPAVVTPAFFRKALGSAYDRLDQSIPVAGTRKPGTTLACICIGYNGVLAAHIGDSRVYQVRPGKGLVFRTTDHSLVNQLIASGEITEAEAAVHPNKNVITRAIQPAMKRRSEPETTILSDIRTGDYFFICCDGVLERLDDVSLLNILSDSSLSDAAKMDRIKEVCDEGTRDNYSAWLIPVEEVSAPGESQPVESTPVGAARASSSVTSGNKSKNLIIIAVAAVVIVAAVILLMLSGRKEVAEPSESSPVENISTEVNTTVDGASGAAPITERPSAPKKKPARTPKNTQSEPVEEPRRDAAQPAQNTGANAAAAAAAALGRSDQGKTSPKKDEPVPVTEPEPTPTLE